MVVGRLAKWTAEDVRAGGGDDGRWAGLKYYVVARDKQQSCT